MSYTLITSLGTGMYKKDGGYRKTKYKFEGDKVLEIETSLFLHAIIESKRWDIKKVILVGTRTSSWDVLIPNEGAADEDLWLTLKDECAKAPGISDALKDELKQKLSPWYHDIEFDIEVHTQKLDADTAEDVFAVYNGLTEKIEAGSNILFDITHGFRSMPMLIYEALQFDTEKVKKDNVEIIYGEFIEDEKISYIRNLSKFWELSKILQAKNLFTMRFDSTSLAEYIRPYWESGAKALSAFSDVVECNYSLLLPETLNQIKNALNDINKNPPGNLPSWCNDVRNELQEIHKRLQKKEIPLTLIEFSKLLTEKGLYTQASIALQVALESAFVIKFGGEEHLGDYKWLQAQITNHNKKGKSFYYFDLIKPEIKGGFRNRLNDIADMRNQIAHGGSLSSSGGKPSPDALRSKLEIRYQTAEEFLEKLKSSSMI